MDKRIERNEHAFDAGWDYVDALYVGAPAYFMMSEITGVQFIKFMPTGFSGKSPLSFMIPLTISICVI
ncbi:MAG: hypothetical protein R2759_18540 [Bacteroidales bacterium]